MITKADAILAINPESKFHMAGEVITYWENADISQPKEEAIQAKLAELQAEYDANQYQRDRLAEYPSIQECIHAILDNDLEALQAKRSAVKDKYPKPE